MKRIIELTWGWAGSAWTGIRVQGRNELHLTRKIWHSLMGTSMACAYLFSGLSRFQSVVLLASALGFNLMVETLRLKNPKFNEAVFRVWAPFARQCEKNRMSGIPFYVGATLFVVAAFPKEIAALSILLLAWGDPVASLFGILFGDLGPRFKNGKSWIGTLAGVLMSTLVASVFLALYPLKPLEYVIVVLVAGIAGGTAELLPVDVDDNFLIPVVSGSVLTLTYFFLGI
jgi:dolichol kinase